MPVHDYRCPTCYKVYEQFVSVKELYTKIFACPEHEVPVELERVFLRAPAGFVQKDICYDSPVDGRAVTSKHARIEDLRRNECVEWEPGMRQDAERKRQEAETRLDKALDETVDAAVDVLSTRKKEKLIEETRAGATLEVTRGTLH